MKHLTLETFTPTVSTRARTDIMRLLAHARGNEPVSEPLGRDLKPLERFTYWGMLITRRALYHKSTY